MGEIEEEKEDAITESEILGEDESRLVIEYEEDTIDNYDERLLLIGLALSFLFGLGAGAAAFIVRV
jgi:hypothetical protein